MDERSKAELNAEAWHADRPYDPVEAIRLERACAAIRRHADAVSPSRAYRLVDVGCGVGVLRQWLSRDRFHITGLDISAAAVAVARQQYDACEVADIERDWPLPPASADGVHAGAVQEHVLDWHAPLNQANRVLGDAGLLLISTPNLRYWKEIRRLIGNRQPHWLKDMTHVHGYTPRFLRELVSLHGFEVVDLEADRVNLPLLPRRCGSRWLAGFGATLILSARLVRRCRVEDDSRAPQFPRWRSVGLRAIEVLPD